MHDNNTQHSAKLGISGRIARYFQTAQITPLIALVALLLGLFAVLVTPREEEPQIVVPIADVYVQMPGASAAEVEGLISTRLEKLLWQIDGVEHVYSMAKPGQAVVTVRYYVGQDRVESLVKLHNKIQSNTDNIPPGVSGWVVKPVEVDDVPIVNLSLYSGQVSDHELRRVAEEVVDRLQSVQSSQQ